MLPVHCGGSHRCGLDLRHHHDRGRCLRQQQRQHPGPLPHRPEQRAAVQPVVQVPIPRAVGHHHLHVVLHIHDARRRALRYGALSPVYSESATLPVHSGRGWSHAESSHLARRIIAKLAFSSLGFGEFYLEQTPENCESLHRWRAWVTTTQLPASPEPPCRRPRSWPVLSLCRSESSPCAIRSCKTLMSLVRLTCLGLHPVYMDAIWFFKVHCSLYFFIMPSFSDGFMMRHRVSVVCSPDSLAQQTAPLPTMRTSALCNSQVCTQTAAHMITKQARQCDATLSIAVFPSIWYTIGTISQFEFCCI